jgi:hypothetical protein
LHDDSESRTWVPVDDVVVQVDGVTKSLVSESGRIMMVSLRVTAVYFLHVHETH